MLELNNKQSFLSYFIFVFPEDAEERALHFFPLFFHKQLSWSDGTAKNIYDEVKIVDNNAIMIPFLLSKSMSRP